MSLTAAQRQKRYRERLKEQNPEKYAESKRKNSERTNANRKKLSETLPIEERRRMWREEKRKYKNKSSQGETIEVKEEVDESGQEEPGPSDTSGIWGSFVKQSDDTASCNLCLRSLPWNIAILKEHLENHHRLNKNEENHSDGDEQNCYTEIVYLEDEELTSKKTEPRLEVPKPRTEPKENRISYESMETENEEIENFGKYVTSLLKKLPKDLCTQLQMDIINLIMTAKLNKMAKQLAPNLTYASVGNTSYLVTLPNVPVGNSSEGIKSFNRDSSRETL